MGDHSRQPIVLVIDALELRRAGIASLVAEWARLHDLSTVAISPESIQDYIPSAEDIHFVILSIGGSSLYETELQDCTKRLRELFPNAPCAVISDRKEAEEAIAAARLGGQAFLSAGMEPHVALHAFTFILGGGTFFPREALLRSASLIGAPASRPPERDADGSGLTRRQTEVLGRLSLGRSNKHIARDLNMQESTVKVHVRQIMRRLGASNRTQAALIASTNNHHPAAADHGAASQPGAMANLAQGVLVADMTVTAHPLA